MTQDKKKRKSIANGKDEDLMKRKKNLLVLMDVDTGKKHFFFMRSVFLVRSHSYR
jgi:hypothetical protein